MYQIEFYSEEKTELGGQRESDFSEKGVNGTSTIIKCTILYCIKALVGRFRKS